MAARRPGDPAAPPTHPADRDHPRRRRPEAAGTGRALAGPGRPEAEELATAMESLLRRVDTERARTHEALVTARDFAHRCPRTSCGHRSPRCGPTSRCSSRSPPDAAARAEIVADLRRSHARVQETLAALEPRAGRSRRTSPDPGRSRRHPRPRRHRGPDPPPRRRDRPRLTAVGAGARRRDRDPDGDRQRHHQRRAPRRGTTGACRGRAARCDRRDRRRRRRSWHPTRRPRTGVPPFRAGNHRQSGSGLGLALIAQQARLHGGVAELSESPWGGAPPHRGHRRDPDTARLTDPDTSDNAGTFVEGTRRCRPRLRRARSRPRRVPTMTARRPRSAPAPPGHSHSPLPARHRRRAGHPRRDRLGRAPGSCPRHELHHGSGRARRGRDLTGGRGYLDNPRVAPSSSA